MHIVFGPFMHCCGALRSCRRVGSAYLGFWKGASAEGMSTEAPLRVRLRVRVFLVLWPGSIRIRSAGGIFGFPWRDSAMLTTGRFKTHIDEFWQQQEVLFNYKSELSGTGN